MISFTAAYFLRLIGAVFLGGPVWMSWRRWERTPGRANAHARHRLACGHLHFARRDFPANLLQRLALVMLWFQPAAWTLTKLRGVDNYDEHRTKIRHAS